MAKNILIIDDSAVVRASLKFALSSMGYEVAEAPNGKEGLASLDSLAAAGKRPSMIICDVNMPVMDGITFIAKVKESYHKFVPILVLTTESQETKKVQGRRAGAAGWLVKPFTDEQLIHAVQKLAR